MASRLTNVARALADGKALPAPPPADTYASAGLPIAGPSVPVTSRLSQREARRHMSSYGGEQAIDTINACINTYVDAATLAEWELRRDGVSYVPHLPKEAPPEVMEAPQDLVALLEQPNPWQNWDSFFALTLIDYLMIGNFYWLKFRPMDGTDRPMALYRLNPADVHVIPGKTELIAGYEYKIPGRGAPVKFPADMVIHGMRPNPHNPYFGLGLVASGARMLDMDLALTETQAQFFEQGAKLSGVLQSDRRVPDAVFKKITMQFRNLYSGSKNAYKVAVLEQGLQFKSIQPTAAENEFVALSNLSYERICRLFRIPTQLLQGEARPGIMQEAKRQFTSDTMAPLLKRLNSIVSQALTQPGWDLDFFMDYKYVMPREDQLKLVAGIAALPGIRINEIREEAGLEPLPKNELSHDGKPIGDMIINLPMPSTENPGGVADQPLPNEAGRPPKVENTLAFPTVPRTDIQRGSGAAPRPNGTGAVAHTAPAKTGKGLAETIAMLEDALAVADARPSTEALERAIEGVLADGKALGKVHRPALVDAVVALEEWDHLGVRIEEIRDRVQEELQEGVRRGYSSVQLWSGYAEEKYRGLQAVVSDWAMSDHVPSDDE